MDGIAAGRLTAAELERNFSDIHVPLDRKRVDDFMNAAAKRGVPLVWILLLPFRILGIAVGGALALIWAIVTLPARVLRHV